VGAAGWAPDNTAWTNYGTAYIFSRASGEWVLQQQLLPKSPILGAFFGGTVGLSATTALVGAYGTTNLPGQVFVFTLGQNGNFTHLQTLTPNGQVAGFCDYFAYAMAFDGRTLVVGALSEKTDDNAKGATYVFELDTSTRLWTERARMDAATDFCKEFGGAVAVDGDVIAVTGGARWSASCEGVYVFRRTGGVWSTAPIKIAAGGSGITPGVAVQGGRAATIVAGDQIRGFLDVYTSINGGPWTLDVTLDPKAAPGFADLDYWKDCAEVGYRCSHFGEAFAFSAGVLATTASGSDAIFMWHRAANGTWGAPTLFNEPSNARVALDLACESAVVPSIWTPWEVNGVKAAGNVGLIRYAL
jgi:hypothetical protein